MHTQRRNALRWTTASALTLATAWCQLGTVQAQTWPDKPVKLVVSAAAGSAPDIIARLIGEQLSQIWGKGVVVDNRPGAGGNLGAQAAARSTPDGYTLWFAHATPVVMNQYLFKNPGFDAPKDFMPIVRVGINPMMIAVNPTVPVKDLKELIALGKSKGGKMSFATSGAKNIPHLVGESLNQMTGANMLNIPYKGSQQAAQDVAGGLAEVYIDALPPMIPWIGSPGTPGRLKPLAVFTNNRLPGFEQIPTAKESGTDLTLQGWMGFMAPMGTPVHVLERVMRDVNAILKSPDIVGRLKLLGTYDLGGTTQDFDVFIKDERRKWERVVRDARIEAE